MIKRKKDMALLLSIISAIILVLLAVFAGNLSPFDPIETNYANMLVASNSEFLLGTDQLGRDMFSRVLHGGKTSLLIAFSVTAIISVTGIILGIIAGYFGGIIDTLIMRIADVLMAFPGTVLVLSLISSPFIEQAKLGGASTFKILKTYLLPNVIPSLLVLISQDIGNKLLAIAGLSLLGLGSQPSTPEWGFMLSEGKNYI
ncbi:MAG: hypothetical protein BEN19_08790 [Epulopiscium sp. Nuni2H_MBin003]|nr:MAG: hypothetical protein BEN19_08790 [Epulopiscium sp. Nuni2H_MBin003]